MGLIIRNIEYDQERPHSRTAGKSPYTIRKSHTIFTKQQEDETKSKTINSTLNNYRILKGSNNQQRINNIRTTTLELSEA